MNITPKLLVICLLAVFIQSCKSDTRFESNKWKKGGGENISLDIRYNMVNDLINSKVLLNKNDIEIMELIGESEMRQNSNDTNKKYYLVQKKHSWNIDPDEMIYLEITFSKQGLSNYVGLRINK